MKRLLQRVTAQTFVLLLISCAKDADKVPLGAAPPGSTAAAAAPAHPYVSSTDEASGKPSFVWETAVAAAPKGASVEAAARYHLGRMARAYGLKADVASAGSTELAFTHDLGRGARIVAFHQRVNGVEVYPGDVKVLMRPNLDLVAISGTLRGSAQVQKGGFKLSSADALAHALSAHFATRVDATSVSSRGRGEGGYDRLALAGAPAARGGVLRLDQPARAKPILYPVGDTLAPAYFVEFFAATDEKSVSSDAFRYVVSAVDGKVLLRSNLTADAAFNYRVWAETDGPRRPLDGPLADVTPHPTGTPDGVNPTFITPNLVTMDGFNTNKDGVFDPWLGTGATQTLGNNVDAYSDVNAPDGFSNGDLRATTTAAGVFDRIYNTLVGPVATPDQQMAAITQLFYTTNWLHDYWYDSGFDEAAGNGQQQNFGRGGLGGDVLHVEAQDGSGRDNANMSTPADGSSPRMQMYVWGGPETRTLTLQPGNLAVLNNGAAFGPTSFNVTAGVALSDSQATPGGAPITDGCTPLVNSVTGKIVLVDRGTCAFVVKVKNAQNAGALAVIIANNAAGPAPFPGGADATITIGTLAISQADGVALKASLGAGPVTATLFRQPSADLDGDLDATVVSHEWGHYLHHRLAVCNSSQQCGAMSEGWADFTALQMLLREGDNLDGTYAVGAYAEMSKANFAYFGIRRFPYSINTAKNGLTFKHISNGVALPDGSSGAGNSEVHNGGEIWAETMFEAYVALQKTTLGPTATRNFTQVQRLMADYVVAGLELTPANATYTEQRDGLLAAILASGNTDDLAIVSAAFARRGMGSCAVSPPRASTDFVGAVESFDVKTRLAIASVKLADGALACDSDGELDVGEQGRVTVQVVNGSAVASTGVDVSIGNGSAGLQFPSGTTVHVPALAAFGATTVTFDVALDPSVTGVQAITFDVTASDANACATTVTFSAAVRGNTDVSLAASATDDVEASVSAWTPSDADSWTRQPDSALAHHWNGADLPVTSDVQLTSPALNVSATLPFVVTLKHRYAFETDLTTPATPIFYDGAVIEVSIDDGATWQDVSTYVAPGYGGAVAAGGSNPLSTRQAFVNKNAASPAYDTLSLDFGTQLAGKTVKLRFRVGSDLSVGAAGWDIDDLGFTGIDNTPFSVLVADQPSLCPTAPQAFAGDDQTVQSGAVVGLDASGSSDVNGDPLTYAWTQTGGPTVTLVDAASAAAVFHAPIVTVATTLTFQVTVSDATTSASDSVTITVLPLGPPPLPDAGTPDAGAPDAGTPDAGTPDAAPATPDAAPGTPDAAPGTPDAAPTTQPDAGGGGGGGDDDGCGCEVGGRSGHGAPAGLLTLLGLGALVPVVRRRRRE
jgi:hypothetical protein